MLSKITPFLLILYCLSSQAQTVQYNQEFQINTYTIGDQDIPSVSGLSGGDFVVCWESWEPDDNDSDIYGRVYKNSGGKIGDVFRVNSDTTGIQWFPRVVGLLDGGFVICWAKWEWYGDYSDVFGQVYNNQGEKIGAEFQVNSTKNDNENVPDISALPDGGFVICWTGIEQDDNYWDIYAKVYDGSGNMRVNDFLVNSYTNSYQANPSVGDLNGGGFVVCWESDDQDGSSYGVFGQIYDHIGMKQGEEFRVNTYTNNGQVFPCVSGLSDGGFVICWGSDGQDGSSWGVFGQIFDHMGTKQGEEFQVNTYVNNDQGGPSVSGLSGGGFVVCWESFYQDGDGDGIFGQLYNNIGIKQGEEFQVNTYTSNSQEFPTVSGLSDGDFVVCWQSYKQGGSSWDIYGKYLRKTIIVPLQPFSLLSPKFDEILISTTVSFYWHQACNRRFIWPWELEYTLYLDITEDFSNPEIFSDIYDSTFSVKNLSPGQTYFWKVLAKTYEGDSLWSSETFGFYVSPAAGIEDEILPVPVAFKLYANYPNPFNPETTIRYSLPADRSSYRVIIKIYDVLGQLVVTLRDEQQRPGLYQLIWDGRNSAGQAVPSGVYFLSLEAGSFKATQKMLLVR